jgi:serine/threonine protein kinase
MLTAKGRVKLSGVGLTELKTFLRDSGQVDGDRLRAWVAPELLDGRSPDISPAADVYSFGIILWELLSREDPLGLTESISNGHLPILGDRVSDRYLHLRKQCCNLQPRERPSSYTIQIQLALLRHWW